ncbi:uncharacterized protein LOC127444682 [Myxocyprinus asiaticus]|uniref:uncharacterized protein LOC127444682 n=1 Tax=Myxocyprinus asiaticus TaxID=70543 RepID=UPI002221F5C7|nr:uncharacterized protein LOC127444682 [Myxocyprinus asiaticus]
MSIRMVPPLPLIFLLMILGVYSAADWGVTYSRPYICALKGSSVIMSCTYKYPSRRQIYKVFWTKTDVKVNDEFPALSDDPEYSQRIQYLGDKRQNCTNRLNDVTQKDSHEYYFRFITDKPDGRWIGKPGVTLDITNLHVESPESVTEGDTVSLTCKSTCNLTDRATFIWLKNTQSLTERNNKLLLQSVRSEDAGRYSCAVHGHNLTSPHVYLNVTFRHRSGWHVALGIIVGCGGLFVIIIIIIILLKMRKRSSAKAEDLTAKQDNFYSNKTWSAQAGDVRVCESADCDAQNYNVTSSRGDQTAGKTPESRDTAEIQYATVQHHRNKEMKKTEKNETHYDNIRINQPDAAMRRSNLQTVEYVSVIYSSIKKPV